jgi:hypothetical protein
MFKVIIAGSRDFDNYRMLKKKVDSILSNIEGDVEIVSGTAKGADELGEKYARINKIPVKRFPAPWEYIEGKPEWQVGQRRDGKKYWKGAGHFRNEEMAKYADAAILFWSNGSPGTANMLHSATSYGLKVRVIKVKPKK